jgi:hypothetical protein
VCPGWAGGIGIGTGFCAVGGCTGKGSLGGAGGGTTFGGAGGAGFAAGGGAVFLALLCACVVHAIIVRMPIKIKFFINC